LVGGINRRALPDGVAGGQQSKLGGGQLHNWRAGCAREANSALAADGGAIVIIVMLAPLVCVD